MEPTLTWNSSCYSGACL